MSGRRKIIALITENNSLKELRHVVMMDNHRLESERDEARAWARRMKRERDEARKWARHFRWWSWQIAQVASVWSKKWYAARERLEFSDDVRGAQDDMIKKLLDILRGPK